MAGSTQAFAQLMNAYAKKIGLRHSHFVNPHGLSAEGHVTTAHDLALLGRALIRDFPEAYSYNKIKEFTVGPIIRKITNFIPKKNFSITASVSRTATCCCGAMRRWTASRPATPPVPATA